MKYLLIALGIVALVFAGVKYVLPRNGAMVGGPEFQYYEATHGTDTVGIYGWVEILGNDSSRGNTKICDNANGGINTANPVYLYFGTASTTAVSPTKPNGYRLGSGECYEMMLDNNFNGPVYAIASTATTTLLHVYNNP